MIDVVRTDDLPPGERFDYWRHAVSEAFVPLDASRTGNEAFRGELRGASLGPLRAWFVDNRYHRIHHSLEERHFDRNFGAFTTLWDRLFGTHYAPEPGEWPDVGLAEVGEPGGVREWLDQPLRYPAPAEAEPAAA